MCGGSTQDPLGRRPFFQPCSHTRASAGSSQSSRRECDPKREATVPGLFVSAVAPAGTKACSGLLPSRPRQRQGSTAMNSPDNDRIRKRAYEIWEREGRPQGRHEHHWHAAIREIAAHPARSRWPKARMRSSLIPMPTRGCRIPRQRPSPTRRPAQRDRNARPGLSPRPRPSSRPSAKARASTRCCSGSVNRRSLQTARRQYSRRWRCRPPHPSRCC